MRHIKKVILGVDYLHFMLQIETEMEVQDKRSLPELGIEPGTRGLRLHSLPTNYRLTRTDDP